MSPLVASILVALLAIVAPFGKIPTPDHPNIGVASILPDVITCDSNSDCVSKFCSKGKLSVTATYCWYGDGWSTATPEPGPCDIYDTGTTPFFDCYNPYKDWDCWAPCPAKICDPDDDNYNDEIVHGKCRVENDKVSGFDVNKETVRILAFTTPSPFTFHPRTSFLRAVL